MIREYTGGAITEPGIYTGIDIEQYHHDTDLCDGWSISSSGLRSFIERPSLYWAYSPYNPNRFERPDKKHFDFGKAAHHLLLEGAEGFEREFVLNPYTDFRTNEAKAWRVRQRLFGKTIITEADLATIQFMRDSLAKHPVIQGGLLDGIAEASMIAKIGKLWIRSRPDMIPPHSGDFADLKTTTSLAYEDIERTIYNYGYHVQAALTRKVATIVMGEGFVFGGFAFVFIEKTPPYDVKIFQLRPEALDLGDKLIDRALSDFEICMERNEWPGDEGFAPSLGFIGIPAWAKARTETALAYKESLA